MNNFENSLLNELHSVVAERDERRPVTSRLRKPGFVALPAGALAAAAAAVVGFGVLGGASAAYAVTTNSNGDVVVTINSLSDASGLQSQLQADGIDASVNYDATGTDIGSQPIPGASNGQHPLLAEGFSGGPIAPGAQTQTSGPGLSTTPVPGTSLLPANVQMGQGSVTLTIPAGDVNSNYKLDITTSGSTSGPAGLVFAWWNK